MITLLISDTTFSLNIFDSLEDVLHPFPQEFNLGNKDKTEKLPINSHKQFYDN